MKALTIQQPFASLISQGLKVIENRTWQTGYRGRLAIHAGSGTRYLTTAQLRMYPTGCVIAHAELVGVFSLVEICDRVGGHLARYADKPSPIGVTWRELANDVHCNGPYCWLLGDVVELPEPVACRGRLGLWDWNG